MPAIARNAIVQTRRAVLTALKGAATVTALVPAASIYPPKVAASPTWPYIRHGVGISTPIKGTCLNGASVTAFISAFAKGGDEVVGAIGDAVADFLDGPDGLGLSLQMPDGRWATVEVEGGQQIIQIDSEADNWQALIPIRVTVSGG